MSFKRDLLDKPQEVEFEEVFYGLLVMVVCDEGGVVYDLWYHPASYHEVGSLLTEKAFQFDKQVEKGDNNVGLSFRLGYWL